MLKNNDFGAFFGTHLFPSPSCEFQLALFLVGVKHEKGRILIDVGWRQTQEGQDFERCWVG